MILYTENAKESTKVLLCNKVKSKNPNKYNNVVEYKINMWKSTAFLNTGNEKPKNVSKKTISFTIESKRIKYLGINLMKKYKTYRLIIIKFNWKKLKTTQIDRKTAMLIFSMAIYRFKINHIKAHLAFLQELTNWF